MVVILVTYTFKYGIFIRNVCYKTVNPPLMDTEETIVEPTTPSTQEETNNEIQDVEALKKELEQKTTRLEKAEHKLKENNIKSKQAQDPVSHADLESYKDDVIKEVREADREHALKEKLAEFSEEEREQIEFHLTNTVKKSGDTKENVLHDIQIAKAIADASRLTNENSELKEAVSARQSLGNASMGSNQDRPKPTTDLYAGFTAAEKVYMQERNFSDEQVNKARETT